MKSQTELGRTGPTILSQASCLKRHLRKGKEKKLPILVTATVVPCRTVRSLPPKKFLEVVTDTGRKKGRAGSPRGQQGRALRPKGRRPKGLELRPSVPVVERHWALDNCDSSARRAGPGHRTPREAAGQSRGPS